MARRIGLAGLGLLAVAVIGAFLARLGLPASVLQFGFQMDPALLVLIGGLLLACCCSRSAPRWAASLPGANARSPGRQQNWKRSAGASSSASTTS